MLNGLGLGKKQAGKKRVDGKGMNFPRQKGASRARAAVKEAGGEEEEDDEGQVSDEEDFGTVGLGEHDDLYDPDLDDLDQQFVDNKRSRHAPGYARCGSLTISALHLSRPMILTAGATWSPAARSRPCPSLRKKPAGGHPTSRTRRRGHQGSHLRQRGPRARPPRPLPSGRPSWRR